MGSLLAAYVLRIRVELSHYTILYQTKPISGKLGIELRRIIASGALSQSSGEA
jgi:hypothetical protein